MFIITPNSVIYNLSMVHAINIVLTDQNTWSVELVYSDCEWYDIMECQTQEEARQVVAELAEYINRQHTLKPLVGPHKLAVKASLTSLPIYPPLGQPSQSENQSVPATDPSDEEPTDETAS